MQSKNTDYLRQVSNLQIEADNKGVPTHPEDQPYCILKNTDGEQSPQPGKQPGSAEGSTHKYEVSETELHRAEHAQDDSHNVQEIGQDGGPLVAQKVKDLSLKGCHLEDRRTGYMCQTLDCIKKKKKKRWVGAHRIEAVADSCSDEIVETL